MLGLMQDSALLISSLIEHAAHYHPAVEIVSETCEGPTVRTNYKTLRDRAAKLARALLRLGVKPGDRIATLAWNTHRHMELYFAVSGIGAVLHTVNPRLFPHQIEYPRTAPSEAMARPTKAMPMKRFSTQAIS